MYKKATEYFKKHLVFHAFVHFLGGLGLGILLTMPVFVPHTLRWGLLLIALALLGHFYALKAKK